MESNAPLAPAVPATGIDDAPPVTLGEVFSNPNFLKFYIGQLVSYLGDRIDGEAIKALLVALIAARNLPADVARTEQGNAATNVTAILLVPSIILGPFVGTLVDRFDRRRLMVAMDVLRAAVILGVALLVHGTAPLWVIYATVFVIGIGTAVFAPAKAAFLPEIIPPRQLLKANSVSSMMGSLMTAVGTPIGAALIVWLGYRGALVIDSMTYVVSLVLLILIRVPAASVAAAAARESTLAAEGGGPLAYLRDLRDAFKFAFTRRVPGAALLANTFFWLMAGLAYGGLNLVIARLAPAATGGTGGDSAGAAVVGAWVLGSLGVGMFVGGIGGARLGTVMPIGALVAVSFAATAALFVAVAVPVPLVAACLLAASAGLAAGPSVVVLETVLQKSVPDILRGRMLALNLLFINLMLVVGMVTATAAAVKLGAMGVMGIAAGVGLAGALSAVALFPAKLKVATIVEEAA